MNEKKNDWMVGYSNKTGKYVPVPIFGSRSYGEVRADCDRLNKISAEARIKAEARRKQK